ncbi:MAG: ATP-binding protein [Pseudomonadota bacterium]
MISFDLRHRSRGDETRRELLALLAAGLACVSILTLRLVQSDRLGTTSALGLSGPTPSLLLLMALVTGAAFAAGALAFVLTQRARAEARTAITTASDLRRELVMAEAVFKAEPQALVYWEHNAGLRVVTHTLSTVSGVPATAPELLRFGGWLDDRSASELKSALDRLFEDGASFNLFLKTRSGGDLEADGRAAGRRAVLRFRDVAGYKHDLVHIIDKQRQMVRDVAASRTLLDTLPMPVWLRDETARIAWVNDAYVKAVEAEHQNEVIDRQIELLETRQRTQINGRLLERGSAKERMGVIVQGERKVHDIITVAHETSEAAVAIDVDELETKKGELDRQNFAHEETLDRVSTAVAIFNANHQLTFFNVAFSRLWELDPNWLQRGPTHPEILDRLRELSRLPQVSDYRIWKQDLLAATTKRRDVEDMWYLPDGRMLEVASEQRADGSTTYLYDDKSEQLALESRYKTMNQVLRETLDSLREGVAVFATDSRLRLFNAAFANLWRLPPAELNQGPRVNELVETVSDLTEPGDEHWTKIKTCVQTLSGEYRSLSGTMQRKDDSYLDYAAIPLPDGGTLVTFSDATATRGYQRALLQRNEALVDADRIKNNFIGHISYQLRTPLTDIMGFSELLQSPHTGELNDRQREYLGAISASSNRLHSIIDSIIDLASMDAGTIDLDVADVDVHAAIHDAVGGIRDRASRMNVTIDIGISDDLKTFRADGHRVRQILSNLVANAVGFSQGGDTVYVSAWRDPQNVVFEVMDQGAGISPEDRDHVFDRFVSQSRGSKHRGPGLGLSIVKSVTELHGGTYELDSTENEGTRVTVRLPHDASTVARARSSGGETVIEGALEPKKLVSGR